MGQFASLNPSEHGQAAATWTEKNAEIIVVKATETFGVVLASHDMLESNTVRAFIPAPIAREEMLAHSEVDGAAYRSAPKLRRTGEKAVIP